MSHATNSNALSVFKIVKPIGHSEIVIFINCCKNPTVSACRVKPAVSMGSLPLSYC